jgi:hypothetical protein
MQESTIQEYATKKDLHELLNKLTKQIAKMELQIMLIKKQLEK